MKIDLLGAAQGAAPATLLRWHSVGVLVRSLLGRIDEALEQATRALALAQTGAPQVRVLEYKDLPGERTHQHRHPAFVLYAVGAFKRKIHLPDGRVLMREFKAGDVMYSPEQVHIGENVGTTPTHVIMVELKTPVQP